MYEIIHSGLPLGNDYSLNRKDETSKSEAKIAGEKRYAGVLHSHGYYAVEYKRCRTPNPTEIRKMGMVGRCQW